MLVEFADGYWVNTSSVVYAHVMQPDYDPERRWCPVFVLEGGCDYRGPLVSCYAEAARSLEIVAKESARYR